MKTSAFTGTIIQLSYSCPARGRPLNEAKRFSQGLALRFTLNSHAGSEGTAGVSVLPIVAAWERPTCRHRLQQPIEHLPQLRKRIVLLADLVLIACVVHTGQSTQAHRQVCACRPLVPGSEWPTGAVLACGRYG
jgi:hypothetical protein